MLSLRQLQDVCLQYQGSKECRYLGRDTGTGVSVCLKQVAAKKAAIDKQVDKFVEQCKKSGQDPAAQHRALANNCQGYPPLPRVQQGYDVP